MNKSIQDNIRKAMMGGSLSAVIRRSNAAQKPKKKSAKKKSPKKKIPTELPPHPVYGIPYNLVCQQRYNKAKNKYDEQFLYELKMQEAFQPSAYDAMRFHRHFAITTLWPPLHNKKEIECSLKMYDLNEKQKKRVKEIMKEKI